MSMVKNSNNPMALLASLPAYRQIVPLIQQYGDPQTAFFALARQKGVDPNTVFNMLK